MAVSGNYDRATIRRRSHHIFSLHHADSSATATTLAMRDVWISYDLYINNVISSLELANGFTCAVYSSSYIHVTPKDVIESHNEIAAKQKLKRILCSNTLEIPSFKA